MPETKQDTDNPFINFVKALAMPRTFRMEKQHELMRQEQARNTVLQEFFNAFDNRDIAQIKALQPAIKGYFPELAKELGDVETIIGEAGVAEGILKKVVTQAVGALQPTQLRPDVRATVIKPPETTYQPVSEAEMTARQRKATLEGELEFQKENISDIIGMKLAEEQVMFPTKLAQERRRLQLQSQIETELGTGETQDITIYQEDTGNERKITIPKTVSTDPKMRQGWIDTNYPGWNEIKVKEKELEDLKLAAWQKALKGQELTPAEKQLIGWEDRPSLSKALQIVSRDPLFMVTGDISAAIKKVNAVADILDMFEKKGIDIFAWYPDARYDSATGQFYVVDELGQKRPIRLRESAPTK